MQMESFSEQVSEGAFDQKLVAIVGLEDYANICEARQELEARIRDLKEAGSSVFEKAQAEWTEKFDQLLAGVGMFTDDEMNKWEKSALNIIRAKERLEKLKKIVDMLNTSLLSA
jgi:flavodoxin